VTASGAKLAKRQDDAGFRDQAAEQPLAARVLLNPGHHTHQQRRAPGTRRGHRRSGRQRPADWPTATRSPAAQRRHDEAHDDQDGHQQAAAGEDAVQDRRHRWYRRRHGQHTARYQQQVDHAEADPQRAPADAAPSNRSS